MNAQECPVCFDITDKLVICHNNHVCCHDCYLNRMKAIFDTDDKVYTVDNPSGLNCFTCRCVIDDSEYDDKFKLRCKLTTFNGYGKSHERVLGIKLTPKLRNQFYAKSCESSLLDGYK